MIGPVEATARQMPPSFDPDGLAGELLAEISLLPAVDCHEHLRFGHMRDEAQLAESIVPFQGSLSSLLLAPYVLWYMPKQVRPERFWEPKEIDTPELRQAVIDALPQIRRRQPAIYRANLTIPFNDLYGYDIDALSLNDWDALDQLVRRQYRDGPWQWYDQLCQCLGVERTIKIGVSPGYYEHWLDTLRPVDRQVEQRRFACSLGIDLFIRERPRSGGPMDSAFERLAHDSGGKLDSFNDYRQVLRSMFETLRRTPAVAFKTGMAGYRRFDDSPVLPTRGSELYEAAKMDDTSWRDWRSMMFGIVAQEAGRIGLPLGIHAGFDGPGRSPAGLEPVIADPDCTDTTFVIIHAGYPHYRDTAELALRNPNVHVDLTWIPIRDFAGGVDAYEYLLETVPPDRLTVGADAHYPETFYGLWAVHLEALAAALARLVRRKVLSRAGAIRLAGRLLHQNAVELYGLDTG